MLGREGRGAAEHWAVEGQVDVIMGTLGKALGTAGAFVAGYVLVRRQATLSLPLLPVDLFRRPDDTHGFEEFRRDAEDAGAWTPVQYYSGGCYPSAQAALSAAIAAVAWLADALHGRRPR